MYKAYIYIRAYDRSVSKREIDPIEKALKDECERILHRCADTFYYIGDDHGETVYLQNKIDRSAFREVDTIIVPEYVLGRRIYYQNALKVFKKNHIDIKIFAKNPEPEV